MTATSPPAAETAAAPDRRRRGLHGLLAAAAVLALLLLLSLALGSKPLPPIEVVEALWRDNGEPHVIVVEQRIPRTVLAVVVVASYLNQFRPERAKLPPVDQLVLLSH